MSTDLKVTIDPEQISEFVQAAILDAISTEARDAIVAKAVEALITPKESVHGFRKTATPLQDAFDMAVRGAAITIARERIDNDPEMQAAVLRMVSPVLAEIAKGTYDGLPERIGEGVGAAVTEWLRERR